MSSSQYDETTNNMKNQHCPHGYYKKDDQCCNVACLLDEIERLGIHLRNADNLHARCGGIATRAVIAEREIKTWHDKALELQVEVADASKDLEACRLNLAEVVNERDTALDDATGFAQRLHRSNNALRSIACSAKRAAKALEATNE